MQDNFLNRDKTQAILDSRPTGVSIPDALNALSKQGFTIEGYNDHPVKDALKKGADMVASTLPVVGGVLGGIGGGILGAGAGIETGPGALATGYMGSVAGAGAGGALGETAKEAIHKMTGTGGDLQPKEIAKQGAIMGGMEAVGGPVLSAVGKGVSAVGKGIYDIAIPTSMKEAGLLQAYKADTPLVQRIGNILGLTDSNIPRTVADSAINASGPAGIPKAGLMGTESMLGVQAKRAGNILWTKLVEPALNASEKVVNIPKFIDSVRTKIVDSTPELGKQSQLLDALKSIEDEYQGVGNVTMGQLQKFKEGWAENIPEKVYQGKPIAGAYNSVRNELANTARQTIYDTLGPEVKQAYFDYGNLKAIQELGKKAMTGSKLKGGTFSGLHGIYDMAVTPVATIGGNVVYKTGKGIQLIGKQGAKVIGDIINWQKSDEPSQ